MKSKFSKPTLYSRIIGYGLSRVNLALVVVMIQKLKQNFSMKIV